MPFNASLTNCFVVIFRFFIKLLFWLGSFFIDPLIGKISNRFDCLVIGVKRSKVLINKFRRHVPRDGKRVVGRDIFVSEESGSKYSGRLFEWHGDDCVVTVDVSQKRQHMFPIVNKMVILT